MLCNIFCAVCFSLGTLTSRYHISVFGQRFYFSQTNGQACNIVPNGREGRKLWSSLHLYLNILWQDDDNKALQQMQKTTIYGRLLSLDKYLCTIILIGAQANGSGKKTSALYMYSYSLCYLKFSACVQSLKVNYPADTQR